MKYITLVFATLFLAACTATPAEVDKVIDDLIEDVDQMEDQMEDMMDDIDGEDDDMEDETEDMDDMDDKDSMDDKDDMDDADAMKDKDSTDVEATVESTVTYTNYSDDVLANGETKVVFFHAEWCPNCRTNDGKLTAWFSGDHSFTRSIYKVDYDTATDLKVKLGVTSQDTFVVVDGAGNVVDGPHVFPSEDKLKELLG